MKTSDCIHIQAGNFQGTKWLFSLHLQQPASWQLLKPLCWLPTSLVCIYMYKLPMTASHSITYFSNTKSFFFFFLHLPVMWIQGLELTHFHYYQSLFGTMLVDHDSVVLHGVKCKNTKMLCGSKELIVLPDKWMKSGMLQRISKQRDRSIINH